MIVNTYLLLLHVLCSFFYAGNDCFDLIVEWLQNLAKLNVQGQGFDP